MVSTRTFIMGCALLTTTYALPTPQTTSDTTTDCPHEITADNLIAIDSTTSTCPTTGDFASECADASRAAPAITSAFEKYDISEPGVQAALIAIMLFESGSFKYNHNHYPAPGRPGQGTRNMQMATFNEEYATTLFGATKVSAAKAAPADGQDPSDAVLALVNASDEDSFGSAAWYLTTKCDASIKEGLATGTSAGWDAYLTSCVGTTHDPARDPSWTKAKEVLGA